MNEYYTQVLEAHMNHLVYRYLIPVAILIFCIFSPILIKKDNEKKVYEGWPVCLFALLIIIGLFCYQIIPIYNDIKQEEFCAIETTSYYRPSTQGNSRNFLEKGRVYVSNENYRLELKLPLKSNKDDFPIGEYSGLVVYSKRSHVIVYFKPT